VWDIGVDVDESFLGPHILTSVVKKVGVAVYDIVESLRDRRFRLGRDDVFDLRNSGVGLGKISPQVPRSILRRLDGVRAEIAAGKIRVAATLTTR
jgi:basic membrane protein A and related proteins